MKQSLLPPDGLKNVRVGISVSESVDLARLGLLEKHFRLALGEIARCVLVSGGQLAYGGHLKPDGYTRFLEQELHRYARRDHPLLVCLAWQEHRAMRLSELENSKLKLGLYGRIVCLDTNGQEIDPTLNRDEEICAPDNIETKASSLTALRHYMTKHTKCRVLIGGKRQGFQGNVPGLLEEALISLENHQPLFLAGGFGGITADMVNALGIIREAWIPMYPQNSVADERATKALSCLTALTKSDNWRGLDNGLTDEENKRLASTHRPGEIASLVSLGLGRRYSNIT